VGAVLAAVQDRRSAMLHSDARALARLLDDQLVYTHSTGFKDDKSALIGKLDQEELVYVALDLGADEVRVHAQTAVVVGRMTATVIVKGEERSLATVRSRYSSLARGLEADGVSLHRRTVLSSQRGPRR
jgi:hypothetical protein